MSISPPAKTVFSRPDYFIAYGLGSGHLWQPFLAMESYDGSRAQRLGLRLASGAKLEVGLELGRITQPGQPPDHSFGLRARAPW